MFEATLRECVISLVAIGLIFGSDPDPLSPEPDPLPNSSLDAVVPMVMVVDIVVVVLVVAALRASVVLLDAIEVLDAVEVVVVDTAIGSLEVTSESVDVLMDKGDVVEANL